MRVREKYPWDASGKPLSLLTMLELKGLCRLGAWLADRGVFPGDAGLLAYYHKNTERTVWWARKSSNGTLSPASFARMTLPSQLADATKPEDGRGHALALVMGAFVAQPQFSCVAQVYLARGEYVSRAEIWVAAHPVLAVFGSECASHGMVIPSWDEEDYWDRMQRWSSHELPFAGVFHLRHHGFFVCGHSPEDVRGRVEALAYVLDLTELE